ncbi:MAG: hypothetical protein A3A86_07120 [Elusimicrobia bacterium RIFCSPLOWO2_01_FULL_60_11]|nr:MAG: hypothetical protein A3A86_07120 [Elusimicrobia bacterium RIFCSPLOWO2_01_FULL_60_11]
MLGMILFLFSCSKKEAPPAPGSEKAGSSLSQSAPQFYYDLGPSTVDASAYPDRQKEGYRVFLAVCGACHTSARPLNSPYVKPGEWKRFVERMHVKMEVRGIALSQADADRIIEFLAYDSKIRKADGGKDFQTQQEKLKALFEDGRR